MLRQLTFVVLDVKESFGSHHFVALFIFTGREEELLLLRIARRIHESSVLQTRDMINIIIRE